MPICWYIAHRIGAISFDAILRILVGRRSGPDAFEGFKLFSSFSMPGTVNNTSGIDEAGLSSISGFSSELWCILHVQSFSLFFGITDDETVRFKNKYAAFSRLLLFDIGVYFLWVFCFVGF